MAKSNSTTKKTRSAAKAETEKFSFNCAAAVVQRCSLCDREGRDINYLGEVTPPEAAAPAGVALVYGSRAGSLLLADPDDHASNMVIVYGEDHDIVTNVHASHFKDYIYLGTLKDLPLIMRQSPFKERIG